MFSQSTSDDTDLRLDLLNQQLLREGREVPLRPKTFDVLLYLAKRRRQLVPKHQLLDAVWGQGEGDDGALRVCVRELRKELADHPREPRFIETLHRRGYRWIGPPLADTPSPAPAEERDGPPLFGRREELERLHACLGKALRGERQLLFITGEAGIGKTALVESFAGRLRSREDVFVAHGQCQELFGQEEAYMPVFEALERSCKEPGGDLLAAHLRRHAPTWALQMPSLFTDLERRASEAFPGSTTPRMLRELAVALETFAPEVPVVLVLEDLHWSDPSTIDLVAALARRRNPARLLILATYRPGAACSDRHPLRSTHRRLRIACRCSDLRLEGLGKKPIAEYLTWKLPCSSGQCLESEDDLPRLFFRWTDGNPLFLVTMVDDLLLRGSLRQIDGCWTLDREDCEIGIADSLQQMIQEKIETLDNGDRELLEVGSVAGLTFSARVVATVLDRDATTVERHCDRLVHRGQFLQQGEPETAGGALSACYAFTHTLYRGAIYQRLPTARKIRLHRQIGEALKSPGPDGCEMQAAVLALHFERGRDTRQAVRFYVEAAREALRRSAHTEAVAHLDKGLDHLKLLPEDDERRRQELVLYSLFGLALMATHGHGAEEVGQLYACAHELGGRLCEPDWQLASRWGVAGYHLMRAEFQKTCDLGEQCLRESCDSSDGRLAMLGHRLLGMTRFHTGQLEQARRHLEVCWSLHRSDGPHRLGDDLEAELDIFGLPHLGPTLWILGYPDRALETCRQVYASARCDTNPQNRICARFFLGTVHQLRCEVDATRAEAEAILETARHQQAPLWTACGLALRGWSLCRDEPREAVRCLEEALTIWTESRSQCWKTGLLAALAAAFGRLGEVERALATVVEALETTDELGERWNEAELLRLQGELLLLGPRRDLEAAASCFEQAIDVARRQKARSWELRAVLSLSKLPHLDIGREEARERVTEIYGRFDEGFETLDLQRARKIVSLEDSRGFSAGLPLPPLDLDGMTPN